MFENDVFDSSFVGKAYLHVRKSLAYTKYTRCGTRRFIIRNIMYKRSIICCLCFRSNPFGFNNIRTSSNPLSTNTCAPMYDLLHCTTIYTLIISS